MTFNELLTETGMTLIEFSKEYGIPYRTLQNWKNGRRVPPDYLLELIARIYRKEHA